MWWGGLGEAESVGLCHDGGYHWDFCRMEFSWDDELGTNERDRAWAWWAGWRGQGCEGGTGQVAWGSDHPWGTGLVGLARLAERWAGEWTELQGGKCHWGLEEDIQPHGQGGHSVRGLDFVGLGGSGLGSDLGKGGAGSPRLSGERGL